MIIKCVSRKANVDQLIKYILVEDKLESSLRRPSLDNYLKPGMRVAGILLTEKDIKHLISEKVDAQLMIGLKKFGGDVQKFIQSQILKGSIDKQGKFRPIVIRHNVRSRSIKGYIKEFQENEKLRLRTRMDSVKAFHHILSFSHLDSRHITEKMLKDIAQQYISVRGPNSIFLGAVHQDKDHIHMHLIQSGTQYCTGIANRISKQQFLEVKRTMQEYQKDKYPELVNSLPEHGRSKNIKSINKVHEKNVKRNERTSDKNNLLQLLETTYTKSASTEQFLNQLKKLGHEPYYRNGRLQGIKYEGERKFRLHNLGFSTDKMNQLNIKGMKQDEELNELQQLRSGRNNRLAALNRQEQAEKTELYEDATKGMDDGQKRDYQQEMLNQSREFERENGIDTSLSSHPQDRSETYSTHPSNLDRVSFSLENLCDDCKRERYDPSYDNPKYYTDGVFDIDKYNNHTLEEFVNTADVQYVQSLGASSDDYGLNDKSETDSSADDRENDDFRTDLDASIDSDDERNTTQDDEYDRDDDDGMDR